MNADFIDGVLIGYDGINPEPFLHQPAWPDGTAWKNEAQARAWFDVLVTSLTDPTADLAGDNPKNHPIKRPKPEAVVQ